MTKQAIGPATDPEVLRPGQSGAPATPDGSPYVHIVDAAGHRHHQAAAAGQRDGAGQHLGAQDLLLRHGGTGAATNAETGANAYAQAYLAVRGHAAYVQLADADPRPAAQILKTQASLTGKSPAEQQAINTQFALLQSELSQLIIQQDTLVPGTIVNKALAPTSPVSPNRTLVLASGVHARPAARPVPGLVGRSARPSDLRHRRDRRAAGAAGAG